MSSIAPMGASGVSRAREVASSTVPPDGRVRRLHEYGLRSGGGALAGLRYRIRLPRPPPGSAGPVPIATVPAVDPEQVPAVLARFGATTAKVKVAEPGQTLSDDVARVNAVRAVIGTTVRVDANGGWSVAGGGGSRRP